MFLRGRAFLFSLLAAMIGGLYIWIGALSFSPHLPKPGEPPTLYSNQSRQDLQYILLHAIEKAQKSIYLVIFGLTDPAIIHALNEKGSSGVKVQVFFDPSASLKLDRFLHSAETVPIQNVGLMHQKILIIDESLIFLGSANMTPSSLQMHDNLVFGFHSPPLAKHLIASAPGDGVFRNFHIGGQNMDLWLLPDPRGHALHSVCKTIARASRSIKIAMFTFTHPSLVDELIRAKRKGIKVTVIVDGQTSLGASRKAIQSLKKAGIEILASQGIQLLHHKFMYIDDHILLSGSTNWTKSAFYKNHDCFLILYNLNDDQKTFMQDLCSRITAEAKPI